MISGRAKCLDVPSGFTNLTLNAEYPIVALDSVSGTVTVTIIDDNGELYAANVGGGFSVTELYAMAKVI